MILNTVGIVAEYNPFHNGHKYHIEQAKLRTGADSAVIVMSGNFVQRGEAAMFDKWARTEMALANGADLVVELPVYYAMQSAKYFAAGAIGLLNALKVDYISFGVSDVNIEALHAVANILKNEPLWYKEGLLKHLGTGMNFPSSQALALGEEGAVLNDPNNILAVEYLCAGAKNPIPIERIGAKHDQHVKVNQFTSASLLRKMVKNGEFCLIKPYIPANCHDIMREQMKNGAAPILSESLDTVVIAHIRKSSPSALADICDVVEGLENRIIKFARQFGTLEQIIAAVKTKRYTYARIRRIMLNSFLGITKELPASKLQYIRVLGLTQKGRELLKNAELPVITKVAHAKDYLHYDILATDLFSLAYPNKNLRKGGLDYIISPIIR